jgi:predicted DNA-binding transcriptional regulator AlpA
MSRSDRTVNLALEAVPTLDAIAADPGAVRNLPDATVSALVLKCATVLAALSTRTVQAPAAAPAADDALLLDTRGIARKLGLSRSWVYQHQGELPPPVSVGGCKRWRPADIERWIKGRRVWGER